MEFLVNAGADLNSKTGTAGQTPLHLAVEAKSKDIIEYLLGRVGKLLTSIISESQFKNQHHFA